MTATTVYITETFKCYVCQGKGFIRLNHAAVATCYHCTDGHLYNDLEEGWNSFERCVADKDPFQNGSHTTWPLFMVNNEIQRFERKNEDIAYAMLDVTARQAARNSL
jgi:hypothetical protein